MNTLLKMSALTLGFLSFIACEAHEKKQEPTIALHNTDIPRPNKQFIKVALLLDTSNSMDGLIDQAKAQLWEIVNELSYAKCEGLKPNLQIALYEYGNDNLNGDEGFIRQVLGFSQDLDEISKALFSLTTQGGNEFCGQVIKTALDQLKWETNPDDLKLIFISGNEPFTQGPINYKEASTLALTKDVTVNTIFCGDYNQGISSYWKNGADLTYGNYMAINHNYETVHIASPFDDTILELNKKLNKTYVAYGSAAQQKMALQAEQDDNAYVYSEANAVSRAVSKSSHLYKNESWDLIDASVDESFEYEELKESDLPKALQGKSEPQIKLYLSKKREERKNIQDQIQDLNLKRKQYILEQQTQGENNLEKAMLNALKTQAKKKNYNWE
jgi:hypothetical protein